jgi:hypothetical protein
MNERMVHFFDEPGERNTDEVITTVVKRAKEGGIGAVVVASISGRMAIKTAEVLETAKLSVPVVCVTGSESWKKYPQYRFPLIQRRERVALRRLGVRIVDKVDEPFRSLTFRDWWEEETREVRHPDSNLFWMSMICVGGHGFRTAIEVVFMAVEAGALRVGQRVVSAAGTGRGLDSAIVLRACRFDDAVGRSPSKRLKVEEILAMPKQTTWRGYG